MPAYPTIPATERLPSQIADALRADIGRAIYPVGGRLPSEARLTDRFGVSRAVLREAIAMLRSEGLLESRQGSGVYVLRDRPDLGFRAPEIDPSRVSSVLNALEMRIAVEVEAAALAAERRSPAQEEEIMECAQRFAMALPEASVDQDLALHRAIAVATNNPMFTGFLERLGPSAIPRKAVHPAGVTERSAAFHAQITDEHATIVTAIAKGDAVQAREAMRRHLSTGFARYRALVRGRDSGR